MLVPMIVTCGLPASIVNSKFFRMFCGALNSQYQVPSCSYLEETLIKNYATHVKAKVLEFVQSQRDLTLTFDSGKLTKKKFWSVHVTTAHRQSFVLELDDVTGISQMGEYLAEVLNRVSCPFYLVSLLTCSPSVM